MGAGMLGGDIGQIQQQANAYRALGDTLVATGGNVVSTTNSAVAALQEQVRGARDAVVSALSEVGNQSRSVTGQFGAVAWTGANRDRVEAVSLDLDQQIAHTTAKVQEIFDGFEAEIGLRGAELSDTATQLSTATSAAGESATSISQAMSAQAAQLDEVMNTGITTS